MALPLTEKQSSTCWSWAHRHPHSH